MWIRAGMGPTLTPKTIYVEYLLAKYLWLLSGFGQVFIGQMFAASEWFWRFGRP